MTNMMIGLVASFFIGSFGYVIVQFGVRPIYKYRKLKKLIIRDVTGYINSITPEGESGGIHNQNADTVQRMRVHSADLAECTDDVLPHWYKLLLNSRGEAPEEASKHLMILSNTYKYDHAQNRIEKIRRSLRI